MKQRIETCIAIFLAVTIVAPYVYLGLLPETVVYAQTTGSNLTNSTSVTGSTAGSNFSGTYLGGTRTTSGTAGTTGTAGSVAGTVAGGAASMFSCTLMGLLSGILGGMASTFTLKILGGSVVFGIGLGNPATVPSSEANLGKTLTDATQAGTGAITAGAAVTDLFIKCVINPLVWTLKQVVIQMITKDIVNWINNGFKGSPMFLTNPSLFFNAILERTTSIFLFQSGLNNLLCSPFRANLLFNLARDMYRNNRLRGLSCSLDKIFTQGISVNIGSGSPNMNSFFNGNFNQRGAGFPAFFKTLQQNNNPYGAYFEAESEAARLARQAAAHESRLLNQGQGWFSMRCDFDGDGKTETVCTPGSLVSHTINRWTNNGLDQLELADSIGEIVNALVAALIKKIFESAGGLLNFGSNYNTSSYWNDANKGVTDRTFSNTVPTEYQSSFNGVMNDGFNSFTESAGVLGGGSNSSTTVSATSSFDTFTQLAADQQDLLSDITKALADKSTLFLSKTALTDLKNEVQNINIALPGAATSLQNARDSFNQLTSVAATSTSWGLFQP